MALEAITDEGLLSWRCVTFDEDGDLASCGQMKTCQLAEAHYLEAPFADKPGKGAMIALPQCACGAHMFLKADYTAKGLVRALQYVEEGEQAAWVLPLRYVRNLQLHWMLYEQGRADVPPVVEMPPQELLQHPQFAGIKPETVLALWYGYIVASTPGLVISRGKSMCEQQLLPGEDTLPGDDTFPGDD